MISSRTPEGSPNRCPVCGRHLVVEPSTVPTPDAPCPHCGCLLHFDAAGTAAVKFAPAEMDDLFERIDARAVEGEAALRLDCGGVDYVDSAFMGKLLTLDRKSRVAGRRLVLCNLNPAVLETLKLTKLDRLFAVE